MEYKFKVTVNWLGNTPTFNATCMAEDIETAKQLLIDQYSVEFGCDAEDIQVEHIQE